MFETKGLIRFTHLDKTNYINPDFICYIQNLFERTRQELKKLLEFDSLIDAKSSDDNLGIVDYNPSLDLESNTSYLVKSFLASLSDDDLTDFGKVSLRNQLFLVRHGLQFPMKPVGVYFLGMLVKHIHDKKKDSSNFG